MEVKVNGWGKAAKYDRVVLAVTASLINETKDTVFFANMSCSYCEAFRCHGDSLQLFWPGCNSNFPKILEIPPGYSCDYDLFITSRSGEMNFSFFQLGFTWLPPKDGFFFPRILPEHRDDYITIWAPPVFLNPFEQIKNFSQLSHMQNIDWMQYNWQQQPRIHTTGK